MNAAVLPGRIDSAFKRENLHRRVWYFGAASYGEMILDEQSEFHVTGESLIDGIDTVVVEGSIYNGKGHLKLWVAPALGYLPIQVQVRRPSADKPFTETRLADLREVAPGLWYPFAVQYGKVGGNAKTDRDVLAFIEVSHVSVSPLDASDFDFEFPLKSHVTDRVLGIAYVPARGGDEDEPSPLRRLGNDATLPSEPELAQELLDAYLLDPNQPVRHLERMLPPDAATERHALSGRWWLGIGLVVVLLLIFVLIWRVGSRSRARAGNSEAV